MPTLVMIPYSPWSIRVKRALRAMDVPFDQRLFIPTITEPWLRWKMRRPLGRFTIPVLLRTDGAPLDDGLAIVKWACEQTSGDPVIPAGQDDAVAHWVGRADLLMELGRQRTTKLVMADNGALTESMPSLLRPLGPVGRVIARDACRRLIRKYPREGSIEDMRGVLQEVREALGDRQTLLDTMSYADIAVSTALDFVAPRANAKIGPKSRGYWTVPELADEFADVVAWRDRQFA